MVWRKQMTSMSLSWWDLAPPSPGSFGPMLPRIRARTVSPGSCTSFSRTFMASTTTATEPTQTAASPTPRPPRERDMAHDGGNETRHENGGDDDGLRPRDSGLIRRSWHAMTEFMSPFSPKALASLPKSVERPVRYTRADAIPDVGEDEHGERPTVRDYHAINSLPPKVRVPKKVKTPVRVEPKVWFANERSEWFSMVFEGIRKLMRQ
jgi:hypothetical protein